MRQLTTDSVINCMCLHSAARVEASVLPHPSGRQVPSSLSLQQLREAWRWTVTWRRTVWRSGKMISSGHQVIPQVEERHFFHDTNRDSILTVCLCVFSLVTSSSEHPDGDSPVLAPKDDVINIHPDHHSRSPQITRTVVIKVRPATAENTVTWESQESDIR